jgi:hypothetical protein
MHIMGNGTAVICALCILKKIIMIFFVGIDKLNFYFIIYAKNTYFMLTNMRK